MKKPDPRDQWTWGSRVWAIICAAGALTEAYGLWYDHTHPGNRKKWTLTSNARTAAGFDSITGEALDVPYGRLRRSALVMFLGWLGYHWTRKGGEF